MSNTSQQSGQGKASGTQGLHVAPSPHISDKSFTTQRMMTDVLISLLPLILMSLYIFRMNAAKQMIICIVSCLVAETLFVKMRDRVATLDDFSAAVTGMILALSLPGTAPWYVGCLASFVAIGIGKILFGGLGMNIFNPAMVGRAFVMIAFASLMGAAAYEDPSSLVDVVSQATPLTALKQSAIPTSIGALFLGMTNGSLGETSALACLLGGIFLCVRGTASWEIPASIIASVFVIAGIADIAGSFSGDLLMHHLFGGALLFGAFFIATDPVTSPLTFKGKIIFGVGTGTLIMIIRLFSGYPEGVMFAVLIMNAVTPLINRWTIPKPMGVA
ncbi:RnfD1 [Desulfamplus magnetovallimortis]|uniref:Ion-translocating oxidoreductase complex subunit D n=1 Tax=Desulfamplus magnetovallimortis TaxID=1246637 RepID=A0A1W1HCF5_9BACT|nr:RnfABCDGE type electron transport complex subunit D [Desulfamplus magnetovallimortis]SLM30082.1 RnfD1 [Desulfamplus magnetovallimortis]